MIYAARGLLLCLYLATAVLLSAQAEDTILSKKLADINPCAALKTDILFTTIGIDRTRHANVQSVSISINDDTANLNSTGALECKTSQNATFQKWVGADFLITGNADLANCDAAIASVSLFNERGDLGAILDAFRGEVEPLLSELARDQIVQFCQALSS